MTARRAAISRGAMVPRVPAVRARRDEVRETVLPGRSDMPVAPRSPLDAL
jgi:hypothetical protein